MKIAASILFLLLSIAPAVTHSQTAATNAPASMVDNRINNSVDNSINNLKYAIPNKKGMLENSDPKNTGYDSQGNRTGYQIKDSSGATNYYDNQGNRIGSIPSE